MNVEKLVEILDLKPHPEGGYYRETYRSTEHIARYGLPERYAADRAFGTAIYYLLTPDSCSKLHRVKSDEIFHFYLGSPVLMLELYPEGKWQTTRLGSAIESGADLQHIVPAGIWQGCYIESGRDFALMGTTVAPGFDFSDFELAEREQLINYWPECADLIKRLT